MTQASYTRICTRPLGRYIAPIDVVSMAVDYEELRIDVSNSWGQAGLCSHVVVRTRAKASSPREESVMKRSNRTWRWTAVIATSVALSLPLTAACQPGAVTKIVKVGGVGGAAVVGSSSD
jgi:hypothetical protein